MKNSLHITIETTAPMHTAFPDNSEKKPDGSRIALTNKKSVKGVDVACHPANGFRGALRRFAANRITNKFEQNEQRISAAVYRGLTSGAASGRPDTAGNSIEELVRVAKHPYMGIFGGGARIFESAFQASDLNIICAHTVSSGMLNAPKSLIEGIVASQTYEKTDKTVNLLPCQFLEKHFFTRVNDLERGGTKLNKLDNIIESGLDGIQALMLKDAANTKDRSDDKDAKKETTSTLLANQAIKTGTPMHVSFTFSPNTTEEQMGLFLLCIQDMFNENYIGGWGRIGWGRYRVTGLRLDYNDETFIQSYDFYDEENNTFNFSKSFSGMLGQGVNAIDSISPEEITGFFENI